MQSDVPTVLGHGVRLVMTGVILGVACSIPATRLVANLLSGLKASDPLTFTAVAGLLIGVALLAEFVPARRAPRVDPMIALRYE